MSHSAEKFGRVNPSVLCFRKFPVAKKFMDQRGGGERVSRFAVGKFLSHSAENFRRGEPFSVSLISGTEKVWIGGGGGEGEYQDFPSKFLSHCTETFHWKNTLVLFEKISFIENFHA